jgi:hypothetical protein
LTIELRHALSESACGDDACFDFHLFSPNEWRADDPAIPVGTKSYRPFLEKYDRSTPARSSQSDSEPAIAD